MLPNILDFDIFEKDGLYGLKLAQKEYYGYVVLPAIYKRIILSDVRSFLETADGKRLEILLETYGSDMICLKEYSHGQQTFFFVDKRGKTVLTIDRSWEIAHVSIVSRVLTGFIYGVATLELSGSNEYFSSRTLIDTEGNVICSYGLDLMEFITNPKDYLNYDGYGMPTKIDIDD